MLEAFEQLNKLNESATDDFRDIAADLTVLEKEIKDLELKRFKNGQNLNDGPEANEIKQLKSELRDLQKSYQEFSHTERVYDDDRYWDDDIFVDNEEKKAAVADQEAALVKKLDELEAKYKELEANMHAETDKSIVDKKAALKSKQELKDSALKAIVEEDRAELEKIISKINNEYLEVTPDWDNITHYNGKIFLSLFNKTETYEIDSVDDIDYDDDEPVIKTDRILDDLQMEADEEAKSIANELNSELTGSWKLLDGCDVEPLNEPEVHHYSYTPATYWDTASEDLDYDETLEYKITYYLVKEI
jgi:hypothetical protein